MFGQECISCSFNLPRDAPHGDDRDRLQKGTSHTCPCEYSQQAEWKAFQKEKKKRTVIPTQGIAEIMLLSSDGSLVRSITYNPDLIRAVSHLEMRGMHANRYLEGIEHISQVHFDLGVEERLTPCEILS